MSRGKGDVRCGVPRCVPKAHTLISPCVGTRMASFHLPENGTRRIKAYEGILLCSTWKPSNEQPLPQCSPRDTHAHAHTTHIYTLTHTTGEPVLKVRRNACRRWAFHLFREKMYFHAFRLRALSATLAFRPDIKFYDGKRREIARARRRKRGF